MCLEQDMRKTIICTIFLVLLASINANLHEVTEKNWERLLSTDEWMVEL
jgi:hypothetical protein